MKEKLKDLLPACLAIGALYFLFHLFGINCPIKYMTGISCPGCGMTRAVLSAMIFRFDAAFSYHPLWILMPPCAVGLLCREWIPEKVFRVLAALVIVLFFITYILRMLDANDMIVVFEPQNGVFGRVIRFVLFLIKEAKAG